MKTIVVALALFGSSAFASNAYDLKMDLSLNKKHVASPRLIVKSGEMNAINQKNANEDEHFIEVIATEGSIQNKKGILMNFTIGTIGKNGEKTILAKPQIIAKENEPAQITIGEKNGAEVSLSVTATRKSL